MKTITNRISLNENQLRRIIKESVKKVINEMEKYEMLNETFLEEMVQNFIKSHRNEINNFIDLSDVEEYRRSRMLDLHIRLKSQWISKSIIEQFLKYSTRLESIAYNILTNNQY